MEIKLNDIIERFTRIPFKVQGVYRYTIKQGSSGSQQSAPFPGFIFPLRGQALYHFDGTPYFSSQGNIIHGAKNVQLDKRVLGNEKWEFISVFYSIGSSQPEDICLEDIHFELTVGQSPRLIELLHRLWKIFNQPGVLPAFQTEVLFRNVLEEVFVCAKNQTDANSQMLYERVISYIHEHYMDSLSVRGLAEQNKVNENRLYYVFKKYAGMGPGDYLRAYRLNRSKELLIIGDAPIGDVAKSVGYPDALYFSRTFNKQFRLSPSMFREKFRNNP